MVKFTPQAGVEKSSRNLLKLDNLDSLKKEVMFMFYVFKSPMLKSA